MKLRRNLLLCAAALIMIGSFFLPNVVAAVTDSRRLDNLTLVESPSISFDFAPELSLPERIALSASPSTERLLVKTGNTMDEEAAASRATRELTRFFSGSGFELDYSELSIAEGSASLVIDVDAPSQNMIVWEFRLNDPAGNAATVAIDDETGMIVRLIYVLTGGTPQFEDGWTIHSDEDFYTVAENLAELMAEYYGLPVDLGDYQYSGRLSYYRADIDNSGQAIPMYGIVTATNFTINERLYS